MPTDLPPLVPGNFYHVYNRGNNRGTLFFEERNYDYFLTFWWNHISPIAETWAYCLLRNDFHTVLYIKNREDLTGLGDLSGLNQKIKESSQYFSNFFNAYARGVNIATQRTGALFERPFKRIPVGSTSYLLRLIVYIHQNPQKHHFIDDFREWIHSSYRELTSDVQTHLERDKLLQLFGSKEDFVRIHHEIQPLEDLQDED